MSGLKLNARVEGGAEYAEKLREYAAETGRTQGQVVRQEARLMSVSLAAETQPFGRDNAARVLGQAATGGDIRRLYASPSQVFASLVSTDDGAARGQWFPEAVYAAIKQGDNAKAERLLGKSSGPFRGLPVADLPDPAIHHAARDRRGRVPKSEKARQIVTQAGALDRYVKAKQKLVGLAKSGWAACARTLGGTRGIPGWVSRQKGEGTVADNSRNIFSPSVTIKNSVSYISAVLRPDRVENAFAVGKRRLVKMTEIAVRKARAKARLR